MELDLKAQDNRSAGRQNRRGPKESGTHDSDREWSLHRRAFFVHYRSQYEEGRDEVVWDGTVNGDQLKGTRTPEGGAGFRLPHSAPGTGIQPARRVLHQSTGWRLKKSRITIGGGSLRGIPAEARAAR